MSLGFLLLGLFMALVAAGPFITAFIMGVTIILFYLGHKPAGPGQKIKGLK